MGLLMSKSEIAGVFDVAPKTVDSWVRRGCPVHERGARGIAYKLHLPDVLAWLNERDAKSDGKLDLNQERAALAREQRRKAAHEADMMEGRLLEASDVQRTWESAIVRARQILLALPAKLATVAMAATTLKEVEDKTRVEIHAALRELAGENSDD